MIHINFAFIFFRLKKIVNSALFIAKSKIYTSYYKYSNANFKHLFSLMPL